MTKNRLILSIEIIFSGFLLSLWGCHSNIYVDDTSSDTDSSTSPDTNGQNGPLDSDYLPISISSQVTSVQPMTGIALWADHQQADSTAIQLEYSYMEFNDVATSESPNDWNWDNVENLLTEISARQHQAILRYYYVYPGTATTVPQYIKDLPDYAETNETVEGDNTPFPDWSNEALQAFTKTFFTEFAARYDNDPRVAFVQLGFGLWGAYHIYEPGITLNENFPSLVYQDEFLHHASAVFNTLQWSISIDAAATNETPFQTDVSLIDLQFGLFDDSFLTESHDGYNADCFDFFGTAKRERYPVGGELSYDTTYGQEHALDLPDGPYGTSFENLAGQYNVSYMVGNDQPRHQTMERIEQAGMAIGYHFEITTFSASSNASIVSVTNTGTAPIFYDAYVAVNSVRSGQSLRGLGPTESMEYNVSSGGDNPRLTIECDHLVDGQEIQFDANL